MTPPPPPPACRSDTYQDSFKSGHPLYYIGHFSRHGQGGSLGSGDPPPPPDKEGPSESKVCYGSMFDVAKGLYIRP